MKTKAQKVLALESGLPTERGLIDAILAEAGRRNAKAVSERRHVPAVAAQAK